MARSGGSRGAVILAGGGSRRMGRSKAWLEFHGRPLLRHVVEEVARECGVVVVAAAPDQDLPPLAPGVLRVDDPPGDRGGGPVVGLASGLRMLRDLNISVAYLGSCDAALIDARHVAWMFDRLRSSAADGVIAGDWEPLGGGGHPLASAVRVDPALAAIEGMLRDGEARARQLFERLDTVERALASELPCPEVLESFNTPTQWAALSRRGSLPSQ